MSEILPEALRILDFWGIHPRHLHEPKNIFKNFVVIFNSVLTLTMMLRLIFTKWEGVLSIKLNADAIACIYQILWKGATVMRHRKRIMDFMEAIEAFAAKFEERDAALQERLRILQGRVKKIYRAFKTMTTVAAFVYSFQPIIYRERFLPFHFAFFCDENLLWCYLANYGYQLFVTVFTVSLTIGGECLFFSLVAHIYTELEVIKYGFSNLDVEGEDLKTFAELVERHNLVLKFIADINKIYQTLFLHQFVSQITFICFGVFDLCHQGFPPSLPVVLKNVPILVAFHMELLIVSATGEFLSNQALAVADAVYESCWYVKHQPRLAKGIIIVIMRAQQEIKIKIGGLWNLEMGTFVVVVKTAVSVMTLMQTFYDFDAE